MTTNIGIARWTALIAGTHISNVENISNTSAKEKSQRDYKKQKHNDKSYKGIQTFCDPGWN